MGKPRGAERQSRAPYELAGWLSSYRPLKVDAETWAADADKTPPGKPIKILAFGNTLKVDCEDPEIQALVSGMINVMTSKRSEGEFTVIKLNRAVATDVARVLDETFNGPQRNAQQQQQQGRGRGGFQFGGGFPFAAPGATGWRICRGFC